MSALPFHPAIDVIDDDEDVLGSLLFLLETEGFVVRTFLSGMDFLEHEPAGSPDCLIIDYKMNGMSGLDLIERLRRQGNLTPVVLITGDPDDRLPERAAIAGIRHVVRKPHVEENLVMHVRQAMSEADDGPPDAGTKSGKSLKE